MTTRLGLESVPIWFWVFAAVVIAEIARSGRW